ncbi:MAG: SRPBCC family protein [Acidimicrobiales bacterium]
MRYADGPTVEVELYVDAPPARVWPLVSDINLPAQFSAEFQGATWLDEATEPVAGARFRGRNRDPAIGEWETTSTIVACDRELRFAWAVENPDHPSASWRFELEPDGTGTRLRQWAELGPGPSGLTAAIAARPDKEERIIARRVDAHRANMLATLEGIKALAEAENPGSVARASRQTRRQGDETQNPGSVAGASRQTRRQGDKTEEIG